MWNGLSPWIRALEGLFYEEKTEGQKSRDTVPLKKIVLENKTRTILYRHQRLLFQTKYQIKPNETSLIQGSARYDIVSQWVQKKLPVFNIYGIGIPQLRTVANLKYGKGRSNVDFLLEAPCHRSWGPD
jgi:hypothetical protein